MKYAYPACFYQEDDGRYSVEFVDFELATFGDNLPDAMYMAADAAAGRILEMLKGGESLPKPSKVSDIKPDTGGLVSLVYIDLESFKAKHEETLVKKTLTIPSWLNQVAEQKNVNFSTTLKEALLERIAR
jgi:predicted RNase H-like HicB family nuclease